MTRLCTEWVSILPAKKLFSVYWHYYVHTLCSHITSYHRLKGLRDELDKLEDKLKMAERSTTSLEAQRKAAVADKGRLAKQVTCQHLIDVAVSCRMEHYSVHISITSLCLKCLMANCHW